MMLYCCTLAHQLILSAPCCFACCDGRVLDDNCCCPGHRESAQQVPAGELHYIVNTVIHTQLISQLPSMFRCITSKRKSHHSTNYNKLREAAASMHVQQEGISRCWGTYDSRSFHISVFQTLHIYYTLMQCVCCNACTRLQECIADHVMRTMDSMTAQFHLLTIL